MKEEYPSLWSPCIVATKILHRHQLAATDDTTDLRVIVAGTFIASTLPLNQITCDGGIAMSLGQLSVTDADVIFMNALKPFVDTALDQVRPYLGNMVNSAYFKFYDANSNMANIVGAGLFNATFLNVATDGTNNLDKFDALITLILNGKTFNTNYICHNCLSGPGYYNGAFVLKFIIGLTSMIPAAMTVLKYGTTFGLEQPKYDPVRKQEEIPLATKF